MANKTVSIRITEAAYKFFRKIASQRKQTLLVVTEDVARDAIKKI